MEIKELVSAIFQYGGTTIMAGLFVWLFFWIITKLNKMLEENTALLKTLAQSENNIARSLDIINNNLITMDNKIDRNYQEEIKNKK